MMWRVFGRWLPALLPLLWSVPAWSGVAPALKIYAIDSKPVAFLNGASPDGMAVEMAKLIQARLGTHESIEFIPLARALHLAGETPNILLLNVAQTPERERFLQYIGTIYETRVSIYAVKNRLADVQALAQDKGRLRVGSRRGSAVVSLARSRGYAQVEEVDDSETVARMLLAGRFDLWVEREAIVALVLSHIGRSTGDVAALESLGALAGGFAFSRGTSAQTIAAWKRELQALMQAGIIRNIQRKWISDSSTTSGADH